MPEQCPECEVLLPDAVSLRASERGPKSTYQLNHCPVCGSESEEWP